MDLDKKLLSMMERGDHTIKFNNKTYKLIGKGGEGFVYQYDNVAIKVYTIQKKDPKRLDGIYREFEAVDYLRTIDGVKDHIVNIHYHRKVDGHIYSVMDLYDGDLIKWAEKGTTVSTKITDTDWLSMAFQLFYAFTGINSHGYVHNDSKPKNIFYKKITSETKVYTIEGVKYSVPISYVFYLGDFSHVRIRGVDPDYDSKLVTGSTSDPDLIKSIETRSDLYESANLLNRILVNTVSSIYSKEKINEIVKQHYETDPDFKERIDSVKKNIFKMKKVSKHIIDKLLFRAQIYELVDYGYISYETIAPDIPNLVFPSKTVQSVLLRMVDPGETFETLFDFFRIR